jgi:hypothetical protein
MNHTAKGHRLRAEVVASALDCGVSAKQLNDRQFEDVRYAQRLVARGGGIVLAGIGDEGVRNLLRNPERLSQVTAELDRKLGL